VPESYLRADGPNVTFHALPYYHGFVQYLPQFARVNQAVRSALPGEGAIFMNVASLIAGIAAPTLQKIKYPYAVEVVSDPANTFAPGTMKHPLRPFLRYWFAKTMTDQCAHAAGASYVTKRYLQERYPCPAFAVGVSDVVIDDSALVAEPHTAPTSGPIHLVFVGSLHQLYKAPDILIEALRQCVQNGLDLHLTMIGDGKYRAQIEEQVQQAGLTERVRFAGNLPGASAVRAELDKADLFILPSRSEGLPRAVVEAMARGLPCISTTVGGIPELLEARDLVPAEDAAALARKITEFVTNPERMTQAAQRNLAEARDYHLETLKQRRQTFYRHIADVTQRWLNAHPRSRV
jgi:glycosyltransferase involved in cell wall biosynthesis